MKIKLGKINIIFFGISILLLSYGGFFAGFPYEFLGLWLFGMSIAMTNNQKIIKIGWILVSVGLILAIIFDPLLPLRTPKTLNDSILLNGINFIGFIGGFLVIKLLRQNKIRI